MLVLRRVIRGSDVIRGRGVSLVAKASGLRRVAQRERLRRPGGKARRLAYKAPLVAKASGLRRVAQRGRLRRPGGKARRLAYTSGQIEQHVRARVR